MWSLINVLTLSEWRQLWRAIKDSSVVELQGSGTHEDSAEHKCAVLKWPQASSAGVRWKHGGVAALQSDRSHQTEHCWKEKAEKIKRRGRGRGRNRLEDEWGKKGRSWGNVCCVIWRVNTQTVVLKGGQVQRQRHKRQLWGAARWRWCSACTRFTYSKTFKIIPKTVMSSHISSAKWEQQDWDDAVINECLPDCLADYSDVWIKCSKQGPSRTFTKTLKTTKDPGEGFCFSAKTRAHVWQSETTLSSGWCCFTDVLSPWMWFHVELSKTKQPNNHLSHSLVLIRVEKSFSFIFAMVTSHTPIKGQANVTICLPSFSKYHILCHRTMWLFHTEGCVWKVIVEADEESVKGIALPQCDSFCASRMWAVDNDDHTDLVLVKKVCEACKHPVLYHELRLSFDLLFIYVHVKASRGTYSSESKWATCSELWGASAGADVRFAGCRHKDAAAPLQTITGHYSSRSIIKQLSLHHLNIMTWMWSKQGCQWAR